MCPVTGNPDWYTVEIQYTPHERILCTKALKEWFTAQRGEPYACETFCQRVLDVVWEVLDPVSLRVTTTQVPRGGVEIVATCTRGRTGPA